jgi:predicted NodU family carbamoyl transferase
MYIVGISAFHDDSAACLSRDGDIVAAAQEERYSSSSRFPTSLSGSAPSRGTNLSTQPPL